jgi:hypothetical protein
MSRGKLRFEKLHFLGDRWELFVAIFNSVRLSPKI